jgi:D-beta-D-heptose 7-phosphate kinase / D-beta-D-heptose 1-phosphate adenosyltransferase
MNAQLFDLMHRFSSVNVLVVGDAMLDEYLEGQTHRLSREAPVPVVSITERNDAPGGAANTALNIQAMGGKGTLLSVIGTDPDGALLRRALEDAGVDTAYVIGHPYRQTLAKRRVAAGGQMIVRYDQGSAGSIDTRTEDVLVEHLRRLFLQSDAVIISDYGYGVLTPRVIDTLRILQTEHPRVIVADAKDLAAYREVGVTAVKPNYGEAVTLLALPKLEGACARAEQMAPYTERVLELTGAQIAAITLDTEGALVVERDSLPYRTYAQAAPDSRAAGAGDTFVAALTLALCAGADTASAAEMAQAAAHIVVTKPGTTICSSLELEEFLLGGDKFFTDPERLASRLDTERGACRRIVFTNGVFDILHRGHIAYLNQAKALGDILVVGVNTDEGVRRLKGPSRPINNLEDRIQVLAGLSSVDYLVAFDEPTPAELMRVLRPDVFVKGGDYTRDRLPEAKVIEEYGGVVQILPFVDNHSTTYTIERIREVYASPAVAPQAAAASAESSPSA